MSRCQNSPTASLRCDLPGWYLTPAFRFDPAHSTHPQALFSFSAAYLVRAFAPYAAGSGISEIKCILGGFIIKGFLSYATTAIKAITLPLTIASGLSVGKEGPSVHYACGIGNVVGELFRRYRKSACESACEVGAQG
jgi:H+/Cl- antiporter ClcA